jgi:flagellar basal body-associated protein FliL
MADLSEYYSLREPSTEKKGVTPGMILTIILGVLLILFLLVLFVFVAVWIGVSSKYPRLHDEIRWDWKKINTSDIHFPKAFIWGTATAAHQVEGYCTNNQVIIIVY